MHQTNQNLFQNPTLATCLSFNLKHAGHLPLSSLLCCFLVSTPVYTETVPEDLSVGPHQREVSDQLLCTADVLLQSPAWDGQRLNDGMLGGLAFPKTWGLLPTTDPHTLSSSVLLANTEKNCSLRAVIASKAQGVNHCQPGGGREGVEGTASWPPKHRNVTI